MPVMIKTFFFLLLIAMSAQAADIAVPPGDGMLPLERSKLQKETKIDRRIKIYNAACMRWHSAFDSAVDANHFEAVPPTLQAWISVLTESLQDIDSNVGRKKKSGALIDYEIQLRKSIKEVKDYRVNAPPEQLEYIDAWLAQAEKIQSKFLDILFLGK
jgi:hypothetical protein